MIPISFLYPFALLGILAIGPLYYFYKNKKAEKSIQIPSFFLLKNIKLPSYTTSKRRLPIRFFFECLCILLLSLSLAVPEYKAYKKKITIIFDLSLSMSAADNKNISRLENAKIKLNDYLTKQTDNNKYYLNLVPEFLNYELLDNNPKKDNSLNKQEILNIINPLKTTPFPDKLEDFLNQKKEHFTNEGIDEIAIFTDKTVKGNINDNINTTVYNTHSPTPNAYLIDAFVSNKNNGINEVSISYGLSGAGSSKIKIKVEEISPNEKTLIEVEKNILGGSENSDVISLGNSLKERSAILKISLALTPLKDSISYDNYAYIIYRHNEESSSIEFITPNTKDFTKEKSSLEKALGKDIAHIGYDKYQSEIKSDKTSLSIFYKSPTPNKIRNNSLIILPGTENEILSISGKLKSPQITSWDTNHSITRYLKLHLLTLGETILLKTPDWGNPVISTMEGPVVISGVIENSKIVISGIELLPFEGNDNPVSSILLLNMLSTLNQFPNFNENVSNVNSEMENIELLTKQSFKRDKIEPPLENGIYRGLSLKTNKKEVFYIHNFYINESDTMNMNYVYLENKKASQKSSKSTQMAWYFLLGTLIILFLDLVLIIFFRREL